jgi:hypothetical protein
MRRQQAWGVAAVAASASGAKDPASANNSRNLAVRRCIVASGGTQIWGKHRTESGTGASNAGLGAREVPLLGQKTREKWGSLALILEAWGRSEERIAALLPEVNVTTLSQ